MTRTKKQMSEELTNRGKGTFRAGEPYEDTLSRSEAMALRGYELVDGEWK